MLLSWMTEAMEFALTGLIGCYLYWILNIAPFNVAFSGLLGRSGPLTDTEMQAFTDFILQVKYPPNPIRA